MADSAEGSSDPQITFKVKTSGESQHTITMPESATVSDLKNKLSGPEFENIPIERQRLIYSGRVLKNEEPLSTYKIKNGNTVHLVKSAASNPTPPAASSSTSSSAPTAPQIPTNMAAGTANNPLAGLTGARYAGLTNLPPAEMFGPDGGMVGSMMDEEQLANMLSNPQVAQQMNEMMNNDAFIDMMIQSNPMLRNNPNARDIVRSPLFRHMMTNPEALRGAARLQRALGGRQAAQNAFPMPGVLDNTPDAGNNTNSSNAGNQPASGQPNPFDPATWGNIQLPGTTAGNAANAPNALNPFAAFLPPFGTAPPAQGTGGSGTTQGTTGTRTEGGAADASQGQNTAPTSSSSPPPNPFASLFGVNSPFQVPGAGAGAGTGAGAGAGGGAAAGANPFGNLPPVTPEVLQNMMQMFGMNSPSGSPAPPDNRPPEERYAEQLRQLNEMGFYDFDRNVAALRRSGGSVQGAIEHLLNST